MRPRQAFLRLLVPRALEYLFNIIGYSTRTALGAVNAVGSPPGTLAPPLTVTLAPPAADTDAATTTPTLKPGFRGKGQLIARKVQDAIKVATVIGAQRWVGSISQILPQKHARVLASGWGPEIQRRGSGNVYGCSPGEIKRHVRPRNVRVSRYSEAAPSQ